MKETHFFTSDEKLKWFGYGEWVEEPDLIEFEYEGYKCKVVRFCTIEPYAKDECYFGGHLCGYIAIPENHPYYAKYLYAPPNYVLNDLSWITFEKDEEWWIGFDCAHSMDIIPSMEYQTKNNPDLLKMKKEKEELIKKYGIVNSAILTPTYKNIDFVINECKSMVHQLKDMAKV